MPDTVFALATAPGRAAVAVVRLSGPGAKLALHALAGKTPAPRRAALRTLRDAQGRPLDNALVLFFPAPASYTGEDLAELHLHGGRAVVDSVLQALLDVGLRPAEPGEFTRRAFENGKLDLAQAEGIADLIDAETAAQAKQALDQMGGALSRRHQGWRDILLESLAFLEAAVDFPDEEVPDHVDRQARAGLERLLAELDAALADQARGRQVREGYRLALVGAPNAGKSSLFNALVEREAAIVTETPGTTRDIIEAPLTLAGYRVLIADTAGLRETGEAIEAEGVRRARAWAAEADLRLWLVDRSAAGQWREAADLARHGDILLLSKSDLPEGPDAPAARAFAAARGLAIMTGSLLEDEVEAVRAALTARVVADLSGADFPAVTRARHAAGLTEARARIAAALIAPAPELAAEDVRLAARALGRITGQIDAESVLDLVFGKFCIGK